MQYLSEPVKNKTTKFLWGIYCLKIQKKSKVLVYSLIKIHESPILKFIVYLFTFRLLNKFNNFTQLVYFKPWQLS